jgi:hypothetical protein
MNSNTINLRRIFNTTTCTILKLKLKNRQEFSYGRLMGMNAATANGISGSFEMVTNVEAYLSGEEKAKYKKRAIEENDIETCEITVLAT